MILGFHFSTTDELGLFWNQPGRGVSSNFQFFKILVDAACFTVSENIDNLIFQKVELGPF